MGTGRHRLNLRGDLVVGQLGEVRRCLIEALCSGGAVDLDATEVSGVDAAGVQLLAVFRRDLVGAGGELRWLDAAPSLRDHARTLGLEAAVFGETERR